MSDFSAGFFTINENKEKIYPYLIEGEYLIQYNEDWVGKLSPGDWETSYQPQTLALSKQVPLLHVMHAEDHGFYLRILHEEEVKFQFEISYEVGADLYTKVGNELYGKNWWRDADNKDERYERVREEWAKQLEQQGILDDFFSHINLESLKAFRLFGISEDMLMEINEILTIKNCAKDSHEMVYSLLDCVGLKQFDFVAHNYVSYGDDDRFTILNP